VKKQKRIADYGIRIGDLPRGRLNKITDVPGVSVGHASVDTRDHKTGVTIIQPSKDNVYLNKPYASSYVLNGHGKSIGLVQIEELGVLESPIALTNTLNVGIVSDALIEHTIRACAREGTDVRTFNPLVCECNDGELNNIRKRVVGPEQVTEAFLNLSDDFEEGDVGAGKGMSCHNLKGGIGSASRCIELDKREYNFGVLVLSNHGKLKDLVINGYRIGREIVKINPAADGPDKGSIIIIIATDVPLIDRQIRRICKRSANGLARLGSYTAHGSGEIAVGFSTANHLRDKKEKSITEVQLLYETELDLLFRAATECVEEAVLNSMITAGSVTGYKNKTIESLQNYIDLLP
jgi:D-aminopeptidase